MKTSRTKKLALNTITSTSLQITTLICGFILPRLILETFGSEVNGLVNSITQFIGVISLLDLGVGAVVQSALYEPLATKNHDGVSRIYSSANKFFRRLAMILLCYIAILIIIYPWINSSGFDFGYTAFLILAISISTFSQYYFSIVNSLLLSANQKGYVQSSAQIVTIIVNTIAGVIFIKLGCSIQIVKLTTSLAFLIRPLFLAWYVRKHYCINTKIEIKEEPIKQKWNGMAQHFASYILSSTDSIVLTIFSTLENVSIYGVYNLVIIGVKNAIFSLTNGFQSLIGEMLVKKETENLKRFFGYVEWFLHTGTTLVFGCTAVLLVSFVRVYTYGIDDADYIQPLFAVLITLANAGHCLRLPYNIAILAAGHYKQTQSNYIIAMILNIVISIATVKIYGLIGVAVGTFVAMMYQTIWMAWYYSKNIINWPIKNFIKQLGVDCLTVLIATIFTFKIPLNSISYQSWGLQAATVFAIWLCVVGIINYVFYKEKMISLSSKFIKKIRR